MFGADKTRIIGLVLCLLFTLRTQVCATLIICNFALNMNFFTSLSIRNVL